MKYKYICIEGNIGVGKTTLSKKIAKDYSARILLEEFDNNPFLPKFYSDPKKYAFPLELFFMAERYNQINELHDQDLFTELTISDYYFIKSMIFAQNNLSSDELKLFHRLFDIMFSALPKPDLLIYLYADLTTLKSNIKKRSRDYEQNISSIYLLQIQNRYLDFVKKQDDIPILLIDVTSVNFLKNNNEYNKIIDAINKEDYSKGLHRIYL